MLTVGSTFTGVGGADLGFEWAGMTIKWQCELDSWKRSVLAAHWPSIPIYEDITTLHDPEPVDLMVGGFPCQDLSIAGKRKGFSGERSVLAFEFLRLAETLKPRWLVLENVPGLLSSNKGLDFQRLLREVVACGYGDVGWRCLDARFFGVPQRRRRIFVVARRTEANINSQAASGFALRALCESGSGDLTPCVPPWQDTSRTIGQGAADGSGFRSTASFGQWVGDDNAGTAIAYRKSARVSAPGTPETWVDDGLANTLNSFDTGDVRTTHAVVAFGHTQGIDIQASEHFPPTLRVGGNGLAIADVASTLQGSSKGSRGWRNDAEGAAGGHLIPQAYPIDDGREIEKHQNGTGIGSENDPAYTLDRQQRPAVVQPEHMSVRRLTPVECERLMGWPDNWTAPEGIKAPDSRRYAACGDGIVANVAYWIGQRIIQIDKEAL